jgi:RHS repeat-associated protein
MRQHILQPIPLLRVYSPFYAALGIRANEWLAMRTLSVWPELQFARYVHMQNDNTLVEGLAVLEGRSWSAESGYRYGFNGKENDDEGMGGGGQTYDYGFRIYNPGLAKFLSVDPLIKKYPELTPYQFASNTPINSIDLDGLESAVCIRWFDANNNYIGFSVIAIVNAADQQTFGANNAQNILYIQATTNQSTAATALDRSPFAFLTDVSTSNAQSNNGTVGVNLFLTNPQNGIVDTQGNLLNGVAFIRPNLQPNEQKGLDQVLSNLASNTQSSDRRDDDKGEDFSQTNNPITIYFDYGSAVFDPNLAIQGDPNVNQTDLNWAIGRLNNNTELTATITGHCSIPQTTNVNPQLGQVRATCVTSLLTKALGSQTQVINGGGQGAQAATGNNPADQKAVITFSIQRTNQ